MSMTTESNPVDDLGLVWEYVLLGGNDRFLPAMKALRSLERYVKDHEVEEV